MIKTKKQMFIVIGVFALVMMLGTVTFAFFNYTRTGVANNISTGTINFNTVQGPAINLNNAFPIDTEETGIMNDSTKVGTVTINVTGDTSYEKGIEYLVKAVNVENSITVGQETRSVPISIDVSVTNNTSNNPATTLGISDTDYYDNRGGNNSIYKILSDGTIEDDGDILVGYIAPSNNGTGIDGNIVIKAYIDKLKVAITDTYPEGDVTHTEGEEPNQETVVDYTNGTTSNWVGTRTVFTTSEWNSLQQAGGISFQVRVEANEGIWAEEETTPESCFTTNGGTITGYDTSCGTNVVIPKSILGTTITEIGNAAFVGHPLPADQKITRVIIPEGIITIGKNAFGGNKIEKIIIPDSITTINDNAFYGNQIENLSLGNGVTTIGGSAFQANRINNLTLPNGVTSIGEKAFLGNYLTSIVIPSSVTSIEKYAFLFNNIQTVILNEGIQSIADKAFGIDASNYQNNGITYGQNQITNVTIPSTVTSWNCDAFSDSVTIDNHSNVQCTE